MVQYKLEILTAILLSCSFRIWGQSFETMIYPLSDKTENIKEIKEKSRKWTSYYHYDTAGLLIRQTNYYKKQKRADYRYEYQITDSFLVIKEVYNTGYHIQKCHYSPSKQVVKYELFFDKDLVHPSVLAYNFVYDNDLLRSYDWSIARPDTIFPPSKMECVYDHKKRLIQRRESKKNSLITLSSKHKLLESPLDITIYIYQYGPDGYLTDQIVESNNPESTFMGVYFWSSDKKNKYHLVFSDFDRYGNWRKSHYLTKKGQVFRSQRHIKYYKR